MTWNDISIWKYIQILDIFNDTSIEDEERVMQLIQAIYNVNPYNMPYQEFCKYTSGLEFIKEKIGKNKVKNEYELNGRKYTLMTDIANINVTQYVDYSNYVQSDATINNFNCILSVFMIPEGHQYNDGYDMNQVKIDIDMHLSICDAQGIADFFLRYFQNYSAILAAYFKHLIRMNRKMTRKEKKAINKQIDEIINMAFYQ